MRDGTSRLVPSRSSDLRRRTADASGASNWEDALVLWRQPERMDDESRHDRHAPLLIVNPADDLTFAATARAKAPTSDGADELQAVLRSDYPRAVVRPRELSGESGRVWYVYRDGHWTRSGRGGAAHG